VPQHGRIRPVYDHMARGLVPSQHHQEYWASLKETLAKLPSGMSFLKTVWAAGNLRETFRPLLFEALPCLHFVSALETMLRKKEVAMCLVSSQVLKTMDTRTPSLGLGLNTTLRHFSCMHMHTHFFRKGSKVTNTEFPRSTHVKLSKVMRRVCTIGLTSCSCHVCKAATQCYCEQTLGVEVYIPGAM